MRGRILIVDDEPGILASLSGVLSDEGYETLCTRSGTEALDLYRERAPDAVFLDIWLPDRDGLETLEAILQMDPSAAVVMMSGHGTPATAARAVKMGAFDYVEKPLSYDQAVDVAAAAITARRGGTPPERPRWERDEEFRPPKPLRITAEGGEPQRTLRDSTVLYGLGLHSGTRTGMVLQPLPPDSGIHFITLPSGAHIPAHVSTVIEKIGRAPRIAGIPARTSRSSRCGRSGWSRRVTTTWKVRASGTPPSSCAGAPTVTPAHAPSSNSNGRSPSTSPRCCPIRTFEGYLMRVDAPRRSPRAGHWRRAQTDRRRCCRSSRPATDARRLR